MLTDTPVISPRLPASDPARSSSSRRCCVWWLACLLAAAAHGQPSEPVPAPEPEVQTLRERLTEREDETRVEDPFTTKLFGRLLSLTGQYEISLDGISRLALGDPADRSRQLLLEQQLEGEAFYNISPSLSLFAQARLMQEEDPDSSKPQGVSDIFVERGEMWFFWDKIAGHPISIEAGRLSFEDDRRWWWDEELDALKISYAGDPFTADLSIARELFSARSDHSYVLPEHEEVVRLIGEATWDWRENHAVENRTRRVRAPGGSWV